MPPSSFSHQVWHALDGLSSHSEQDGVTINVDMLKTVRLVEALSGEKLVYLKGKGVMSSEFEVQSSTPNSKLQTPNPQLTAEVEALRAELTELRAEVKELREIASAPAGPRNDGGLGPRNDPATKGVAMVSWREVR